MELTGNLQLLKPKGEDDFYRQAWKIPFLPGPEEGTRRAQVTELLHYILSDGFAATPAADRKGPMQLP